MRVYLTFFFALLPSPEGDPALTQVIYEKGNRCCDTFGYEVINGVILNKGVDDNQVKQEAATRYRGKCGELCRIFTALILKIQEFVQEVT